jgi:hypothetical protein
MTNIVLFIVDMKEIGNTVRIGNIMQFKDLDDLNFVICTLYDFIIEKFSSQLNKKELRKITFLIMQIVNLMNSLTMQKKHENRNILQK